MAQLSASSLAQAYAAGARSDGQHIPKLIQIGSTPKSIKKVQALAAKTNEGNRICISYESLRCNTKSLP
jgi:hypothetical protein